MRVKSKKKKSRRQLLHRRLKDMQAELKRVQELIAHYELIIKCPICLERKKNVMLECGHALCKPCWQTVTGHSVVGNCPMDRKLVFSARELFL
jgi:hypothetical protein